MKRTALILSLATGFMANTYAQAPADKKNVEKLCGCFSVNFRYAETFSPDEKYKYHDREDMNAIELALPIENTDRKLMIQHLLVINDTMIIKHWREEWTYESPVLYQYEGDKKWTRKTLPATDVKGKWTQTVWEVNDEPRYQGISAWINNDGKTYWESSADAPLPRREYTTRQDYNILRRQNRLIVNNKGYMHEQDNEKINRTAGNDQLIAQEKGYNKYLKVEDSECTAAKAWWKKNEQFWSVVRKEWDKSIANAPTIAVKSKVDDKILHVHFESLYADWKSNKVKNDELPGKVKEVITKFL